MAIATLVVNVPADEWEAIKSTFMAISNMDNSNLLQEVCEEAIEMMERIQEASDSQEPPEPEDIAVQQRS
ncbi:MAG: hypothetical protein WCA35_01645 [Kovacikia sp.]